LIAATCRRAECRQRLLSQAVKWNSRLRIQPVDATH
jgi:hypothetical protein